MRRDGGRAQINREAIGLSLLPWPQINDGFALINRRRYMPFALAQDGLQTFQDMEINIQVAFFAAKFRS